MDLMYIRNRGPDIGMDAGFMQHFEADFDITTDTEQVTNDFEIKMSLPTSRERLFYAENEIETIVYVEGTEYGGKITGSIIDTDAGTITYTGRTWRGSLSEWIIEPPEGQDYKVVSGNLSQIIRQLPQADAMEMSDTDYSIESFKFERYISTYEGIAALLYAVSPYLRLSISFGEIPGAYDGKAVMSLDMSRDLTELIEVSQDFGDKIMLKIEKDHTTPRHLICLGQGELKDREVIHLYADEDWNISQVMTAEASPTEVYDSSSTEDLLTDGINHFQELIDNHERVDASVGNLDIRLGDVISARDNVTGENITAEITGIVLRITNYGNRQNEDFEYKTKIVRR